MALLHQGVGAAAGLERAALRVELGIGGADRGDLVGDLGQRGVEGLVVGGDGGVVLRGLALEVGAQLAAFEDRQGQGGAGAEAFDITIGQRAEAEGGVAGEGGEVDVRVEARLGHVDLARGGFHLPARGDDVGAPAEQLQRQILRQRRSGQAGQGGDGDAQAAVGAGAEQFAELVAGQQDLLVELGQLVGGVVGVLAGAGALDLAVQPGAQAFLGQDVQALALLQQLGRHLACGALLGQLVVGAGQGGGEGEARLLLLGLGRPLLRDGAGQVRAVLAPQVQLVGQAEQGLAGVGPTAAGLGRAGGGLQLDVLVDVAAVGAEQRGGGGQGGAVRGLGLGLGGDDARAGALQVRVVGQGLGGEGHQLRVLELAHPVGAGPGAGTGETAGGLERLRLAQRRRAHLLRQAGTAGHGEQAAQQRGAPEVPGGQGAR